MAHAAIPVKSSFWVKFQVSSGLPMLQEAPLLMQLASHVCASHLKCHVREVARWGRCCAVLSLPRIKHRASLGAQHCSEVETGFSIHHVSSTYPGEDGTGSSPGFVPMSLESN